MARRPRTLLEQAARSVLRASAMCARQIEVIEWRRAQGWSTEKAEAALMRMERALADKRSHLALLQTTLRPRR